MKKGSIDARKRKTKKTVRPEGKIDRKQRKRDVLKDKREGERKCNVKHKKTKWKVGFRGSMSRQKRTCKVDRNGSCRKDFEEVERGNVLGRKRIREKMWDVRNGSRDDHLINRRKPITNRKKKAESKPKSRNRVNLDSYEVSLQNIWNLGQSLLRESDSQRDQSLETVIATSVVKEVDLSQEMELFNNLQSQQQESCQFLYEKSSKLNSKKQLVSMLLDNESLRLNIPLSPEIELHFPKSKILEKRGVNMTSSLSQRKSQNLEGKGAEVRQKRSQSNVCQSLKSEEKDNREVGSSRLVKVVGEGREQINDFGWIFYPETECADIRYLSGEHFL